MKHRLCIAAVAKPRHFYGEPMTSINAVTIYMWSASARLDGRVSDGGYYVTSHIIYLDCSCFWSLLARCTCMFPKRRNLKYQSAPGTSRWLGDARCSLRAPEGKKRSRRLGWGETMGCAALTNHPHRNRILSVETNQEFGDGWEQKLWQTNIVFVWSLTFVACCAPIRLSKHLDRGVICSTYAGFRVNIGNGHKNRHS